VMIMGYSATMDLWDPRFLSDLSSQYNLIIFDNLGMGYTTASPRNFSIADLSNDTSGLMDAVEIE
jgi:pimeloyl-ACP methyl ester carboxylesterase